RNNSKQFAMETALCFAANGIKTYIFDDYSPTPLVSFAIRNLGANVGINITASHNTKEYNGYKVYLSDGSQFSSPEDKEIIEEINNINDFSICKTMSEKIAKKEKLIEYVPKKIWDKYIEIVSKQVINKKAIDIMKNKLKIVYTPLHGTGERCISSVIKKFNIKNFFVVESQNDKNGDFCTIKSPNPENRDAFKLGIDLAKQKKADLVIATDPDADRIGVLVKNKNNEYISLTGNMLASIMCEYILHFTKNIFKNKKSNYDKYYIIKSFVTSRLLDEEAKYYNVEEKICLTGFKWIGKEILNNEKLDSNKRKKFLFAAEESYGALVGDYVRDKDSISALLLTIEIASFFKIKNLDLTQVLNLIYKKYGYFIDNVDSFVYEGISGKEKMSNIMTFLSKDQVRDFYDIKVDTFEDYNESMSFDHNTNILDEIKLPRTNAIFYKLEDGSCICIRPSGTEPKIKIYYQVKGNSENEAKEKLIKFKKVMNQFM
ncbi:MAG: phospho-sugar mutase, partial [Eubacteriales bacterium]|nr:phospho-sugar mutase [Eubacteriales bacterium]